MFAPPLAPAEEAACDALSSKDWNPVTVSGLRAILIPRDDAWVPPELQRAFGAAADVAVEELHCGRGHAVAGGWPEVLQKLMDRCAVA